MIGEALDVRLRSYAIELAWPEGGEEMQAVPIGVGGRADMEGSAGLTAG